MRTTFLISFICTLFIACSPLSRNAQQLDLIDSEKFHEMESDWMLNENYDEQAADTTHFTRIITPQSPPRDAYPVRYPRRRAHKFKHSKKVIIPLMGLAGGLTGFSMDFLEGMWGGPKTKYKYTIGGTAIGLAAGTVIYLMNPDEETVDLAEEDLFISGN